MLSARVSRTAASSLRSTISRSRQFSSLSRDQLRPRIATASQGLSPLRSHISPAFALGSTSHLQTSKRFQSTTPTPPTPQPELTANDLFEQLSATVPSITDKVAQEVTPHIGFLKEAGLDFGWGPTSVVQFLAEHIHVYGGTEWWVTLIATSLTIRLAMFWPMARAASETTKQVIISPEMLKIQAKYKADAQTNPSVAMQRQQQELKRLKQAVGLKTSWMLTPMVAQGMLGFGTFRFARNLIETPNLGLTEGGVAWIKDLTIPDPYFAVPLAMMAVMHIVGRLGGESASSAGRGEWQKNLMLYGLPAITGAVMVFQPAAVQAPLFAMSFFGIIQARLFRSDAVRAKLGMVPLSYTKMVPKTPTGEKPKGFLQQNIEQAAEMAGLSKSKPDTPEQQYRKQAENYEKRRLPTRR